MTQHRKMKVYIFVGGKVSLDAITIPPKDTDICIAADSGFDNAATLGFAERINKLVGDLDSIRERNIPQGIEVIRVPAEKDVTDTQLAVSMALDLSPEEIVIIGGLSGRLDHTLANLSILEALAANGIYASICDGFNRVRFVSRSALLIPRSDYKYFSLICIGETASGVSIDGAKYPLKNAKLSRSLQYAVSNEVVGNCAMVSVKKGSVFVIESKEKQI